MCKTFKIVSCFTCLFSFNEDGDFGLWKVKMQAVLIQQKCAKTLKGKVLLSYTMSQEDKTEIANNPKSVIILCLKDNH